ncbi:unnamed protein product [Amoebophrya sp. A25]|nr:unnamed protein product [Amoebophrya sp. A25]|eukprot:GSA25T00019820001.1
MTRSGDALAFEKAWREAAAWARQHNEARVVIEVQCQKLRTRLEESERLRSLETQRLAAQIEKMRLDTHKERERIEKLETEFSLAFEDEVQRLRSKHESETTKEAIVVVERLKKDLAKSEREKADLMSKLAQMEKTAKARDRKKTIISAYSVMDPRSSSSSSDAANSDNIIWSIFVWDLAAILSLLVVILALIYGGMTETRVPFFSYHAPDYDYAQWTPQSLHMMS